MNPAFKQTDFEGLLLICGRGNPRTLTSPPALSPPSEGAERENKLAELGKVRCAHQFHGFKAGVHAD